ncbi:hypothetical protein [Caloramator sp. Dgby_cultured_2]|uniref:hypothetical protein n=1 Tax=Caloramator sp. Dgby_cultured_2 TaxID=3029174 RepID=UPI00237DA1FF|nr:hypothetical protein [Caloramator sp. Dgby_cultured_2]WDU82282.1 hypothetical protein PWK10_11295 [Caloramator sp. Dgby_cultured_2]
MNPDDYILCPLLKKTITRTYCHEICFVVEGLIDKSTIDDKIDAIQDYEKICFDCENHID